MEGIAKSWREKPNALTRSIWNKLIRRNSTFSRPQGEETVEVAEAAESLSEEGAAVEERAAEPEVAPPQSKVKLSHLVEILRLMEVPSSLLQDLLEVISERFSLPGEPEELPVEPGVGQGIFQLTSSSSDDSHLVSTRGFLLLDSNAL